MISWIRQNELLKIKEMRAGLILVLGSLSLATLGSYLAPFGFDQRRNGSEIFGVLETPNDINFFGTNALGMDVLSRAILGFQPAFLVIIIGIPIAAFLGLITGLLAGFFKGWVDKALNLVMEVLLSFPPLLIALVTALTLFRGDQAFAGAILAASASTAIPFWAKYHYSVRVESKQVSEAGYVQISKATGIPTWRILVQQILPNSLSAFPVIISRQAADSALVLAGLGFLGLGISPDRGAEWGYDLALAAGDIASGVWWTALPPMLALTMFILGPALLAEWGMEYRQQREKAVESK